MSGNTEDTVLLLACNSQVGSTRFLDTSIGGESHQVSNNTGNTVITSVGKFDQGIRFAPTGSDMISPDSVDYDIGVGLEKFCIDGWMNRVRDRKSVV